LPSTCGHFFEYCPVGCASKAGEYEIDVGPLDIGQSRTPRPSRVLRWEARPLDEILSDAGVGVIEPGVWFVRREGGGRIWIDLLPLFPDRVWHALPG
jgi:hypothetical protein